MRQNRNAFSNLNLAFVPAVVIYPKLPGLSKQSWIVNMNWSHFTLSKHFSSIYIFFFASGFDFSQFLRKLEKLKLIYMDENMSFIMIISSLWILIFLFPIKKISFLFFSFPFLFPHIGVLSSSRFHFKYLVFEFPIELFTLYCKTQLSTSKRIVVCKLH